MESIVSLLLPPPLHFRRDCLNETEYWIRFATQFICLRLFRQLRSCILSSHLWQSGNSDTMLDTTINKRYLLWEKTLAKSWSIRAHIRCVAQAGEDDTRYNKIYIQKAPQMGRSTAIKRRKFNKLIVLCENECGVVSMCSTVRRLTSILYGVRPCRLSSSMCYGFVFSLFFSILYSVLVAEPRAALIRSKS